MVEEYEKLGFKKEQLREIRKGLEEQIDITKYAKIELPSEVMFDKRWQLIFEKSNKGA